MKHSPVKSLAIEHDLQILQPSSLRGLAEQEELESLQPDLMVVVAYGLILPKAVIDIPRLGCINIHASLLPRWRGAAPIQRSIMAGDAETGVTIMFIEPRLDAGPMLTKKVVPISRRESAGELHDRLAMLGAEALTEALPLVENGLAVPEVQDESAVTYAQKISKDEAGIDWSKPAIELERQILAFNPWPVAETRFRDQPLRIWRAAALPVVSDKAPGSILNCRDTLDVMTGEGMLRIEELQLPGAKRITARDFLNAHPSPGPQLG